MTANYPRGSGKSLVPNKISGSGGDALPCEGRADLEMALTPSPEQLQASKKRERREMAEQIAFFDQVRQRRDEHGRPLPGFPGAGLVIGTLNESAEGTVIRSQRWKMGVRAGWPDITVAVPRHFRGRDRHGLFIEMKCSDGVASDVRASQKAVHDDLDAEGYEVVVAFGWRRAFAVLCEYLSWEE